MTHERGGTKTTLQLICKLIYKTNEIVRNWAKLLI